MFKYPYPRPSVTVDIAVFSARADDLVVLLIRRKKAPFKGGWALPGGFVDENESLERACSRELEEETGLSSIRFEQLRAYGDPGRDPRGHTVSVAFFTFIHAEKMMVRAGDDAEEVAWVPLARTAAWGQKAKGRGKTVELAFDHKRILDEAKNELGFRLQDPARARTFELVPPHFTLDELQRVHELVWSVSIEKRKFRANVLASGCVEPLNRSKNARSNQLYQFKRG